MSLPVLVAALAVNLLTAWVAMAFADPDFTVPRERPPRERRPRRRRGVRPEDAPPLMIEEDDEWVAHEEPLVVAGGAHAIDAAQPVLAYVQQSRRSPARDRFIQTEVLLPEGFGYRILALLRLVVAVTIYGVALGLSILFGARLLVWLFQTLFG